MDDANHSQRLKKAFEAYIQACQKDIHDVVASALGALLCFTALKVRNATMRGYSFNAEVDQLQYLVHAFEKEQLRGLDLNRASRMPYQVYYRHRALHEFLHAAEFLGDAWRQDIPALLDELAYNAAFGKGLAHTPAALAQLMFQLISDGSEGSLFDPAYGTGENLLVDHIDTKVSLRKIGVDQNRINQVITALKLICADAEAPVLHKGNPFRLSQDNIKSFVISNIMNNSTRDTLGQYDLVISNPPNLKLRRDDLYSDDYADLIPCSESVFNYIQLGLKHLNDKGKGAFLVNMGALFRSGNVQTLREHWIEQGLIKCVIELPTKLLPYTVNKCAIVLFDKAKTHSDIQFVKADDLYTTSDRGQHQLQEDSLAVIQQRLALAQRTTVYACASYPQLKSNQYSLHPNDYLAKEVDKVAPRIAKDWLQLGKMAAIKQGNKQLGKLPRGTLEVIKGEDIARLHHKGHKLRSVDISQYQKPLVLTAPNDLLLKRIGDKLTCYIAKPSDPERLVDQTAFRIRFNDFNLSQIRFIAEFLQSERGCRHVASFCQNTTAQTLTKEILSRLDVPIASQELQDLLAEMENAQQTLHEEAINVARLKKEVFEGIGHRKLDENFDKTRFAVNSLEEALANKDNLAYKVSQSYPYPIAYPYRIMYLEREHTSVYDHQMKFGEQLLSFLTSISMALLTHYADDASIALSDLKRALSEHLRGGLSPGHWRTLLQMCCEKLRDVTDSELAAQLVNLWFKGRGKKQTEFAQNAAKHLISPLNAKKHFRGPQGEQACKRAVEEQREILENLLNHLHFLPDWQIFVVDKLIYLGKVEGFQCKISELVGDHPRFKHSGFRTEQPLIDKCAYLRLGNELIELSPFIIVIYDETRERSGVYSLDKQVKPKSFIYKSFDGTGEMISGKELTQELNDWLEV